LILRTSRFFPEPDDDLAARAAYADANLKTTELLHRRVDIEDVVGFGRYIISATTPFSRDDVAELRRDAASVVSRRVPGWDAVYARLGWRMAPHIERVYDNSRTRADLGWQPRHDGTSGEHRR
jgi:UDP-glucose 4-epimerase